MHHSSSSSSAPPLSENGVRINVILRPEVAQQFFQEIPPGKRSALVSHCIAEWLVHSKRQKAIENIKRLREQGKDFPVSDPRDSLTILRELRYRHS